LENTKQVFIGDTPISKATGKITGEFITIEGESFYKISNVGQMSPFFISMVSDEDHWMFISSNGALTAGRKNPESALFPYYTDDKIHDSVETTGSKTIIRAEVRDKTYLWEPFSNNYRGAYQIQRNLYKNVLGNKILFEEINESLGLQFSHSWLNSKEYGFIRKASLSSSNSSIKKINLLDGIQNLLPYGTDVMMQNERSNLLNAYKKNELLVESGLAIYCLSSIPVDKAEPSEALTATTVWSAGLSNTKKLLSSKQLNQFRLTGKIVEEWDIRAERCAYFINSTLDLESDVPIQWYIVADLNKGPAQVSNLHGAILEENNIEEKIEADIADGNEELNKIIAAADGFQHVANLPVSARHSGNVLFNVMRGGTSFDNYQVKKEDFVYFLKNRNSQVFEQSQKFVKEIPDVFNYVEFFDKVNALENPAFERLYREYLPLGFSRRHGDPSRPWNQFNIDLKNEDGRLKLAYEGNWRDIFQNWEALGLSFPGFIESMICKFVNASTLDGYNPYRITSEGIDWEVIEPDNPWSYIGYWGDHQIIYLLKLMEISHHFHPGDLLDFFSKPIFCYANVPYRIKPYTEIIKNSQDTVDFDMQLELKIEDRVKEMGADGKLVLDQNDQVLHVNLIEKLLATSLAKMSNFVPEGGIWLNTQRPEWNDANNALVGNGLSMVTVYYMRRFFEFLQDLLSADDSEQFEVSSELTQFFSQVLITLRSYHPLLNQDIDDERRRKIVDALGKAGSDFRTQVYDNGLSGIMSIISRESLLEFMQISLDFIDHTIIANKRADDLYHAYNLLTVEKEGKAEISRLYEMLEGQVAVLSAGLLKGKEVLRILDALKSSSMYREDQHSYLLYPDKKLPRFENKNKIPEMQYNASELMQELIKAGNQEVVVQDRDGQVYFNGHIRNARDLRTRLDSLNLDLFKQTNNVEKTIILNSFEEIFDHKSFTGRSGTFFGYEGLGCIYWHMVSKLILAIQENCFWAIERGEDPEIVNQLIAHYYDARLGLGFNKSPDVYGAFPSDPYSHTPGNKGAQQPGMTGQVKEDILSRFGELGLIVENGTILFKPYLLEEQEFITNTSKFNFYDVFELKQQIDIPPKSLAFTFCQVPFIYHLSDHNLVVAHFSDGSKKQMEGLMLPEDISEKIFNRTGDLLKIELFLNRKTLKAN
jgi:hypothetical protein